MNMEAQARVQRLKQAINDAGGNRRVSDLSGVPLKSIYNYLNGREMKGSVLERIAAATRVPVEWLISGTEPPHQAASPSDDPPFFPQLDKRSLTKERIVDLFRLAVEIVELSFARDRLTASPKDIVDAALRLVTIVENDPNPEELLNRLLKAQTNRVTDER